MGIPIQIVRRLYTESVFRYVSVVSIIDVT